MSKFRQIAICGFALLLFLFYPYSARANSCPNPNELQDTTLDEQEELLQALHSLVPEIFRGDVFVNWEVMSATPFPMTIGKQEESPFFEWAKQMCGGQVTEKSWLVRLYFPTLADLRSHFSERQLFVAKNQQNDWFVWYQYD